MRLSFEESWDDLNFFLLKFSSWLRLMLNANLHLQTYPPKNKHTYNNLNQDLSAKAHFFGWNKNKLTHEKIFSIWLLGGALTWLHNHVLVVSRLRQDLRFSLGAAKAKLWRLLLLTDVCVLERNREAGLDLRLGRLFSARGDLFCARCGRLLNGFYIRQSLSAVSN